MIFSNDFRITEATDYAGLIFKNQLGAEILNMNEDGDLKVSNGLSAQSLEISGDTTITGNTSVTGNMTLNNISPDTSLTISLGTDQGDDLIIGNDNTLVVEGDTEHVGIGTSSPAAKLDVVSKDGTNATGLIVNQQDLDQITMQLASSTNTTATMFDLSTNNVSGNMINLDWDIATQAQRNIIGTNLDFTNLTPTNNSSNYLYGIHLNDPATNNDSNSYAIYVEGTSWDKGLVSDSPIQTNSSFILQDSNSQTNTISIKAPTLASSYILTLPTTAGIAGQYLTTDGEGNLTWTSPSNANAPLNPETVTDTASSSVNFTSLNGNKYYEYNLSVNIKNTSGEAAYLALLVNGDGTPTNYYIQYEDINGNTVNTGNNNNNYLVNLDDGQTYYAKITITKDISNYVRGILQGVKGVGASAHNLNQTITTANTVSDITSIGIKSVKTSDPATTIPAIAVGSEFVLTGQAK